MNEEKIREGERLKLKVKGQRSTREEPWKRMISESLKRSEKHREVKSAEERQ